MTKTIWAFGTILSLLTASRAFAVEESAPYPILTTFRAIQSYDDTLQTEWTATIGYGFLDDTDLDRTCKTYLSWMGSKAPACYIYARIPMADGTELHQQLSNGGIGPNQPLRTLLKRLDTSGGTFSGTRVYKEAMPGAQACTFFGPLDNDTYGDGWGYLRQGTAERYAAGLPDSLNAFFSNNCAGVAPSETWCAMEDAALDFSFGSVTKSEWYNRTKSAPVRVRCSGTAKYMVSLRGRDTNVIPLSNGGTAELTVDGAWGNVYSGVTGSNSHTLTATLTGEPSVSGSFRGEGVLMVTYP